MSARHYLLPVFHDLVFGLAYGDDDSVYGVFPRQKNILT